MRINQLHIDGYGRFVGQDVTLGPGLQIVFGPNERGKSTLRSFIGHMLYGQKSSLHQRRYEDSHELRRPWKAAPRYGGRLIYELDNGYAIEVHREFDKKEEFIQVFDRTNATDITAEFEQYRNREIGFATAHLGIGKNVFEHVANIGHWSLADFGGDDALGDIRDRIVALADSASEEGTAESALKLLDDRALAIGRRAGQVKRPLPAAKARLEALEAEWNATHSHLATLQDREIERQRLAEELAHATARRKLIAVALGAAAKQSRAVRLREAERLADEIRVATQQVFEYRRAAEFPLEEVAEAQRAANAVQSSRSLLTRASEELQSLHAQYNEASARVSGPIDEDQDAVSEALEQDVSERQGKIDRLTEKLVQYEADFEKARRDCDNASETKEAAPNFDAIGPDPAARLTEIASSFRVAEQSNSASLARATQLQDAMDELRSTAADIQLEELSGSETDELAEAHTREGVQQTTQALTARRRFMRSLIAGTLVGFLLSATFTGLAFVLANGTLILPAVLMALGGVGAGLSWTYNLALLARDREAAAIAMDALNALDEAAAKRAESIESIRRAAGIESDEQLEDHLRARARSRSLLIEHEQELDECNRSAQRADAEIVALRAQHNALFENLGESITDDEPTSIAVHRLLAAYQAGSNALAAYQRAQERMQALQVEIAKLRLELKALQGEQAAKLVDLRETLRKAGFGDEARHFDALDALRAYRKTLSETRERKVRADTLGEHRAKKEQQREEARAILEQDEAALQARFEQADVATLEEWEARAGEAKAYREARQTEHRLQDKLADLLAGTDLEKFRRQVADDGPMTPQESSIIEEQIAAIGIEIESDLNGALRTEHDKTAAAVDALQASHHALQLELAAAAAATRPLNEIEEEREEARSQVATLEFEFEAVSHAAAVIDEVARDRHARLAPKMTEIAGEYLSAITGGAYRELMLNRELGVSVRVPETARFANEPRQMLSKGTVDQIYLALRLALVRVFSDTGESIPMLLDDPFSNYDDDRLRRAIELLQEVSKINQIVLFTCREDVVKAATGLGVESIAI